MELLEKGNILFAESGPGRNIIARCYASRLARAQQSTKRHFVCIQTAKDSENNNVYLESNHDFGAFRKYPHDSLGGRSSETVMIIGSNDVLLQPFDNAAWSSATGHHCQGNDPVTSIMRDCMYLGLEQRISMLGEAVWSNPSTQAYPARRDAVSRFDPSTIARAIPGGTPGVPDKDAAPREITTCTGCEIYRGKEDWEHTRILGQCRWPHDDPFIPSCPGCIRRKPMSDPDAHTHTSGCRANFDKARAVGTRTFQPRKDTHPRDPGDASS